MYRELGCTVSTCHGFPYFSFSPKENGSFGSFGKELLVQSLAFVSKPFKIQVERFELSMRYTLIFM
jgi:hypothetical protein